MTMPNIDQEEEISLVRQAQSGDAESFGRLYDVHIRKIYDFIFYKTFNKDVAEDVTSSVFLKAWKNIGQFKDGSFGAWLFIIARNAVVDHYRREKETSDIEDFWDLADGTDTLGAVDDRLKVGEIRQAMSKLKVEERELIIMRLWLDLPFKEIALRLGKKEGAVKVSFGRVLSRLKDNVSPVMLMLLPEMIHIWKNLK